MSSNQKVPMYPVIDAKKVGPEVHTHLQLIYDRIQNHASSVEVLTSKIAALEAQIAKLQGTK